MSQETVVQSLFQNQHGLCPILPCQVESVSEVVLPPEEGIEIIRDEQDLWSEMFRHISGACFRARNRETCVGDRPCRGLSSSWPVQHMLLEEPL